MSPRQENWRTPLFRMALLIVLWLVVAFLFATEFYLSARGGPLKITWMVAADSAFRDWSPWILLTPLAVILAGQFRFRHDTWRRSLMVHIAACIIFTIAYQSLLELVVPAPYFLSGGGVMGITSSKPIMPPGMPGIGVGASMISQSDVALDDPTIIMNFDEGPGHPFPASGNTVIIEEGKILGFHEELLHRSDGTSTGAVVHSGESPMFAPPRNNIRFNIRTFSETSNWAPLLHMAMSRAQFTIPMYWCIICLCSVLDYFQETRERERRTLELESRLTQANLQALKMQLQPHFLFNTLNSISSLIHENPKAADDMIGSLSQFLRTTLEMSENNEVPLRMEIEFVDRYLEIQQTRFGHRLHVNREIDSAVMDALVPPLVLQPLVENAIRYGIECREAGGTVTIRALRQGNVLHLEICDDGEGFSGGQMLGTGNGIGLSNTKARLEELYGTRHQFKITAGDPTGVCVMIEIPFQLAPSGTQNKE